MMKLLLFEKKEEAIIEEGKSDESISVASLKIKLVKSGEYLQRSGKEWRISQYRINIF